MAAAQGPCNDRRAGDVQARPYDAAAFTVQLSDQRLVLVNSIFLMRPSLPRRWQWPMMLRASSWKRRLRLLREMSAAALADGVSLRLVSGYQAQETRQASAELCKSNSIWIKGLHAGRGRSLGRLLWCLQRTATSGTGYAAEILSGVRNADAGFAEDRAFSLAERLCC